MRRQYTVVERRSGVRWAKCGKVFRGHSSARGVLSEVLAQGRPLSCETTFVEFRRKLAHA
jgi:hypothetical protein